MNNPLNATDPSGYFRWKKLFKFAAVIAVGYFTGGAAASWMGFSGATYGSAIAAATTGAGATLTSAAVVGGAMGFTASFTGAALNGANFQTALKAGVSGGITGAVLSMASFATADWGSVSKVLARAGASGEMSKLQGGSFAQGFKTAFIMATAAELYKNYVGFEATAESGENQPANGLPCNEEGSSCFKYTGPDGKLPANWENKNVIGLGGEPLRQDDGFFNVKQSGPISRALNMMPGMNNIARLHDTFFGPNGLAFTGWNNVGTMLPAAAWGYAALYDKLPIDSKRCPSCAR
jgi:hypothetical protein